MSSGHHCVLDHWRFKTARAPVPRWPVLPVLSGRDQALATPSIANARPLAGIDAREVTLRLWQWRVVDAATRGGRAAADAVSRHEVEGALGAALDWLPAFDRQPLRRRHQGDLLQGVAAIRHLGWDRVVLALVRERLPREGLE